MQVLEQPTPTHSDINVTLSRRVRPFVWYIVLVLLSFVVANLALNRVEKRDVSVLRHSILLYSSHNAQSNALAAWAQTQLSLHTIDLLGSNAGATVYQLTGSRTILSPTLLMPTTNGYAMASGSSAVSQALQPVMDTVTPVQKARQALLVMAGLILLALILRDEVSAFASLLPAAGLVALGALWGHCWHCYSGTSTLSTLAPLLGLLYLGGGMALFTVPLIRQQQVFIGFLACSALIPVAQAYMLVSEPKLCPACLTVTFISACYFAASIKTLRDGQLPGVAAPKWLRMALVIGLMGLFVRHSLVLAGYVTLGGPAEETVPSIIGSPVSKYLTSSTDFAPGTLLVVTLPGCHVCEQAERDLPGLGLTYKIVPTCSVMTTQSCFDGKGITFPTPMLLVSGTDGRIVYQHEGWVGSVQESEALAAQIANIQGRIKSRH